MALQSFISTLSLYSVDEIDGCILVKDPTTFSLSEYSRYKYGASRVGERYGQALCEKFLRAFFHLVVSRQLLITSSPYKTIPTSSLCIAQSFCRTLNQWRCRMGFAPSQLTKIGRATLSAGDYGVLSKEQRISRMKRNRLSFDTTLLAHADLVVVDDIKVTGAHQQCIMSHIEQLSLTSLTFLYVVECCHSHKEVCNPQIEDHLNHISVHTLADMIDIIRSPDFFFNVRMCKFILNEVNRADLPAFLQQMTDQFVAFLYHMSLKDGYGHMNMYRESVQMVASELQQRGLEGSSL
ncbi:MAG TPA: phosphoribosyltransferase family protein [Dictyobacter sp.]|jgi:hypothetical protein|nr:phosphoribosyltransferase family protein [Dictyobacter sp.]